MEAISIVQTLLGKRLSEERKAIDSSVRLSIDFQVSWWSYLRIRKIKTNKRTSMTIANGIHKGASTQSHKRVIKNYCWKCYKSCSNEGGLLQIHMIPHKKGKCAYIFRFEEVETKGLCVVGLCIVLADLQFFLLPWCKG